MTEYATELITAARPRTGCPYAPASVDRALASIAVAHKTAGLPVPPSTGARLVLRGYERQLQEAKDPARRPRWAAAATPAVLRQMVAATDTTTLTGLRDAAVLLLGFALAARRSELRLLDGPDVVEVEQGMEVDIYRPKVSKEQPLGIPYGSHPASCPVRATRAYRAALVEAGHPPTGPLFVRIDRHGRIAPSMHRHGEPIGDPSGRLTGEAIGDIVTRAATRAGLDVTHSLLPNLPPRWSGHSLRRGFATAAKAAGDLVETGRHGGWADGSAALVGYFEEAGTWDDTNPLYGIDL